MAPTPSYHTAGRKYLQNQHHLQAFLFSEQLLRSQPCTPGVARGRCVRHCLRWTALTPSACANESHPPWQNWICEVKGGSPSNLENWHRKHRHVHPPGHWMYTEALTVTHSRIKHGLYKHKQSIALVVTDISGTDMEEEEEVYICSSRLGLIKMDHRHSGNGICQKHCASTMHRTCLDPTTHCYSVNQPLHV